MNVSMRGIAAAAMLMCAPLSHATLITYTATNVADSTWRYDYSITNDTLGVDLEELTLFFALGDYLNLNVVASPAGWDSIVVQPDAALPDDGFFDSLALAIGIAPGATLAGFSVSFDWLGIGAPGAQTWNVVDPLSFATLDVGQTVPAGAVNVPEPGSLALFGFSVSLLGLARRRQSRIG